MDEFRHVQCKADIIGALERLDQEETVIKQEMDSLLSNENEIDTLMATLVKQMSNVGLIETDAERLRNLMQFTSVMADNVSYKIKSFDLVKKRVSECLKQVEDIIDLRSCTEGIQRSLNDEDYEEAARHIYRFLSMDETMLRKTAMETTLNGNGNAEIMPDTCSLEQSFVKLHEAEQNLKFIVMTRFDEAVTHKDAASVERFFKIFPLIKQHRQGLDRFSNYLWSQIFEEIESKKINAATKGSVTLAKLSQLFETIAQKIDVHYPLIETYYGPGNLYPVIKKLQDECDTQAKSIIGAFQNEKSFASLVSNVSRALNNVSGQTGGGQKLDPKAVDRHLNDIMYMINRSQTYLNFISTRLMDDLNSASNNQKLDRRFGDCPVYADRNEIETLIRECTLAQIIHDLNSVYVFLEEYFLKESIQKAIQLDTVDAESKELDGPITSSMLDDIFFIIKKCLKRSVSCGSINVILAMVNHCVMVLETVFFEVMNERIKCGYANKLSTLDLANAYNAIQAARYLQPSAETDKMRISFISALNNLDTACEYVDRLSQTITDDVTKSGILQKNQVDLFDSCLSNFSSLNSKFRMLITSGMQQLFASVFKSTVKAMIDSFVSASHVLNDDDVIGFEVTESLRSFMQTFLVQMNSQLMPFKKQLTERNFDSLLEVNAAEISNRLYKALFNCTFNKFGGFQLDREIRAIINFLSSLSATVSLREYFAKLKFIGVIFTMENIDEINDYINSDGNYTALRVNPNELRQLLRLYTELSQLDIRKIKI